MKKDEKNKHYDVIIIGGGPGGLECANVLSRSNKSVLLLEKNAEIGPKVCAGGLTMKSVDFLKLPVDFGGKRCKTVLFKTMWSSVLIDCVKDYMHVVDRKELGEWQLEKINSDNVEIRKNAKVSDVSRNSIVINNTEKIDFTYLVGADGSNSVVRRFLKIKTRKIVLALQYIIRSTFSSALVERNAALFGSGYAWIFPQGNVASVGVGIYVSRIKIRSVLKKFEHWLSKENIDVSSGEFQSFVINCDFRGYRFGNVFLIGDAAGLASPLTGEGIYQALVSGNEVANLIIDPKYKTVGIDAVLWQRKMHIVVLNFLRLLGPLKIVYYEMFLFASRNKYFARFAMKFLS